MESAVQPLYSFLFFFWIDEKRNEERRNQRSSEKKKESSFHRWFFKGNDTDYSSFASWLFLSCVERSRRVWDNSFNPNIPSVRERKKRHKGKRDREWTWNAVVECTSVSAKDVHHHRRHEQRNQQHKIDCVNFHSCTDRKEAQAG